MQDLFNGSLIAFAGAGVAALIALLGAWIQNRREHARWLREKRFEAYLEAYDLLEEQDRVVLREHSANVRLEAARERPNPTDDHEARIAVAAAERELRAAEAEQTALAPRVYRALASVRLLGPDQVEASIVELSKLIWSDDPPAQRVARDEFFKLASAMLRSSRR